MDNRLRRSKMIGGLAEIYQETQAADELSGRLVERAFWEIMALPLIAFYVLVESLQDWLHKC